jgi:hypothetical protein
MHDLEHATDEQRRANKDRASQGEPDNVVPGKRAEQDHQDAEGDEPAPASARPPICCHTGRRHRITHLDVLCSSCDQRTSHYTARWTLTDIRQFPAILGPGSPFFLSSGNGELLRRRSSWSCRNASAFVNVRTVLDDLNYHPVYRVAARVDLCGAAQHA